LSRGFSKKIKIILFFGFSNQMKNSDLKAINNHIFHILQKLTHC